VKNFIFAASLAAISLCAHAQDKKEPTPQQALMGTCNAEAKTKELKGDERKKFMSTCLADGRKRQQEVMKACNADAKDKKGEDRKKFMASCLKK
jgi:hypothetical protein